MIYRCTSLTRRSAILDNPAVTLNGIDYLEVTDQQTLLVHCLKAVPSVLTADNVLIAGGESITDVRAVSVAPAAAPQQNVLVVGTSKSGDFSTYILRLVSPTTQATESPFNVTDVYPGFDPQLAEVSFSFKVECGPEFDCGPQSPASAQAPPTPPPINYQAKDYGSFRTVLLDRLHQLLPTWGGTSEADLGVVLAELIAYRSDYLSYQQDAIATEAFLDTARSRVSLRRHARLMDYHVHDGCNARTWVQLTVAANPGQAVFLDATLTRFYTYAPGMPSGLAVGAGNEEAALMSGVQVFQPMQDALLYQEHNQMFFYTWGNTECCLPRGAVEATLDGSYPHLQAGDVVIFQEMIGPQTGNPADADLRQRCAVRLTQVATVDANGQPLVDPLFDQAGHPLSNPATQNPTPITEIQWSQDDAIPFAVCISSSYLDSTGTAHTVTNVSVALGNVVLADRGLSIPEKSLGRVPAGPARFRPTIPDSPLTQQVPLQLAGGPAAPRVVLLDATGSANLLDANGLVCLTIQGADPAGWPHLFGVIVEHNQATPTNFDLSVVYNPAGGAAGMTTQATLERFTNLSLNATDVNYVAATINTFSTLIQVPSSYVPPTTAPADFPVTPFMLPDTGTVNLQDLSDPAVTFLTLQATSPVRWLRAFGVLAHAGESPFSLSVVYYAPSGGVGVTLPVTLEQFLDVSPETLAGQFNSTSQLLSVKSFAQAPDLRLSAHDLMNVDPASAVPVIALEGTFDGTAEPWSPEQDLLVSAPSDRVFVVEIESDGTASLRFATPSDPGSASDTTNGRIPDADTEFVVSYRIGNGTAGNVGADSLVYLAAADARIQSCINPLPASGGTDLESNDQIRRRAPQAFLTQERSVTMADYEAVAESTSQVNQAVASLRWTGSWYSVFIAVEPAAGGALTPALQETVTRNVERYRLAGQDLQLESPQYVSLQLTLEVLVDPSYFQSDVKRSLTQVLGNQMLSDGRKGLFYPDNFTFGQTVYLSPVYAAARSVPGVVSVTATRFQPQGVGSAQFLSTGQIKLGSLQVARLDNDPSYPDHGQLTLVMQGGK